MLNLAYNIKIISSKPPILEKQILNRWLFYKVFIIFALMKTNPFINNVICIEH